jgi:hypothetical protein
MSGLRDLFPSRLDHVRKIASRPPARPLIRNPTRAAPRPLPNDTSSPNLGGSFPRRSGGRRTRGDGARVRASPRLRRAGKLAPWRAIGVAWRDGWLQCACNRVPVHLDRVRP